MILIYMEGGLILDVVDSDGGKTPVAVVDLDTEDLNDDDVTTTLPDGRDAYVWRSILETAVPTAGDSAVAVHIAALREKEQQA